MVKESVQGKDREKYTPPDIFQAARDNDPYALAVCLERGDSLLSREPNTRRTPIHVAAQLGYFEFVSAAIPHARDALFHFDIFSARPIEHARARGNQRLVALISEAMFGSEPWPVPPAESEDEAVENFPAP